MSFIGSIKDFLGMGRGEPDVLNQLSSIIQSLQYSKEFIETSAPTNTLYQYSVSTLKPVSKDETVQMASDMLVAMVLNKIGSYHNPDKELEDLYNRSIESMDGSFYSHVKNLLQSGINYGYGVMELVFQVQDGEYRFGWAVNHDPADVIFKMAKNEYGREFISSVVVNGKSLPAQNFIIYTYGDLSNPYGYGRLNYCKKFYDLKDLTVKLLAIYVKKFTIPTIIGQTGEKLETLHKKLEKWLNRNIFTIRPSTKISLLETANKSNDIFEKTIDLCKKTMFQSYFQSPLLTGGEKGGSYALGSVQLDLLEQISSNIAEEFIDNVLISQVINRLFAFNVGVVENYGTFYPNTQLTMEEKDKLSNIIIRMGELGILEPDVDERWIRESLGMPLKEE